MITRETDLAAAHLGQLQLLGNLVCLHGIGEVLYAGR